MREQKEKGSPCILSEEKKRLEMGERIFSLLTIKAKKKPTVVEPPVFTHQTASAACVSGLSIDYTTPVIPFLRARRLDSQNRFGNRPGRLGTRPRAGYRRKDAAVSEFRVI